MQQVKEATVCCFLERSRMHSRVSEEGHGNGMKWCASVRRYMFHAVRIPSITQIFFHARTTQTSSAAQCRFNASCRETQCTDSCAGPLETRARHLHYLLEHDSDYYFFAEQSRESKDPRNEANARGPIGTTARGNRRLSLATKWNAAQGV